MVVDNMYCNARTRFMVSNDRLMDVVTVHALAAVGGQQSRMNVDDAVRVGLQKIVRNQEQETCEDDVIHTTLAQEINDIVSFIEVVTIEIVSFYAQVGGTNSHECITLIIYYYINFNFRFVGKVLSYLLCVGTVTGGENSQFYRIV